MIQDLWQLQCGWDLRPVSQPAVFTAHPTHLPGMCFYGWEAFCWNPQRCHWSPVSPWSLVETKQVLGWMSEWHICETEASDTSPVWGQWQARLESCSTVVARVTPALGGLGFSQSWFPFGKLSRLCPTWSHTVSWACCGLLGCCEKVMRAYTPVDNGSWIVGNLVTQRSLSLRTLFRSCREQSKPAFPF